MIFTVNQPLKGHDEDAPAYADDNMLVVCDGLGGGGQNTYLVDGVKHTSAYLGSRRISAAFTEFIKMHVNEKDIAATDDFVVKLKKHISESLDRYVIEKGLKNIVKGKSMQMLPSTLASIIYEKTAGGTDVLVISAGDSRAYVLTPEKGLQQISKDDVFDDVDAYEKTATMTNNIRQDGDYHINYRHYFLPEKCVLFVCSDGCFDYISTPMEFERLVEYAILTAGRQNVDIMDNEKNYLGRIIEKILVQMGLHDDCTMAGAVLGYESTSELSTAFENRYMYINENYKVKFAELDKDLTLKKHESEKRLPAIEREISEITDNISKIVHSDMLDVFKKEIGGDYYRSAEKLDLMTSLNNFPLYKDFVDNLFEEENEKFENVERLQKKAESERSVIRELFNEKRFDDLICSLEADAIPLNTLPPAITEIAESYCSTRLQLNDNMHEYEIKMDIFKNWLIGFENDCFDQTTEYDISRIREHFDSLLILYNACRNGLYEIDAYKKSIKQSFFGGAFNDTEFNSVMLSGFRDYRGIPSYESVINAYDKYNSTVAELASAPEPLSEGDMCIKFEKHLDEHFNEFLSMILNNPVLRDKLFGDMYSKLDMLLHEKSELTAMTSDIESKKYSLWLMYKSDYELFNNSKAEGCV